MHAIEVTAQFPATHQLRLPGGTLEPRHGHVWHVTVQISAPRLDEIDTVLDFHEVQRALEAIVGPWRHAHLNEVPPFAAAAELRINPSAERVAEQIAEALAAAVNSMAATRRDVRVIEVRVTEAAGCAGIWRA